MTKAEYRRAFLQARRASQAATIEAGRRIRREYVRVFSVVARAIRESRSKAFLEERVSGAFPRKELYGFIMGIVLEGRAHSARLVADINKQQLFDALDKAPGHGLSKGKIAAMFDAKVDAVKLHNSRQPVVMQNIAGRGFTFNPNWKPGDDKKTAGANVEFEYDFKESRYSLSKSVWDTVNYTEEEIRNVVRGAIAQGRDLRSIGPDLMAYVKEGPAVIPGRWGKLEPGAKEYIQRLGKVGVDYRVIRLYRSEKFRYLQEEAVAEAENNPACTGEFDWVLLEGRAETGCGCKDLAAGGPYTKDTVPEYPHPSCLCTIQPRLKDHDDFIRELQDYVRGEPGGDGIARWAAGNGLGEPDGISDPDLTGETGSGSNRDPEKVKAYLNRTGQKIVSVQDEMELIRNLGIDASGTREYATIYSEDGTILHVQEGNKPGEIDLPQNIRDILRKESTPKYTLIHNHASGESFSLGDLEHLVYYRGFKTVIAIGHNKMPYIMSIAGGRRPTLQELRDLYNMKFDAYWDLLQNRMANKLPNPPNSGIRMMSGINKFVKKEFGWYYYDEVKYE